MLFTVKNQYKKSDQFFKTEILLHAYFIINNYPLRATEQLLNNYLQKEYKVSLKDVCIKLLLNISFNKNDKDDTFILTFKDPKYDKIAQVITYGTGVVPGCQILQRALTRR